MASRTGKKTSGKKKSAAKKKAGRKAPSRPKKRAASKAGTVQATPPQSKHTLVERGISEAKKHPVKASLIGAGVLALLSKLLFRKKKK